MLIKYAILSLISLVRPLLGPAECKYALSCMQFAKKQLDELPLHKALWRITRRVLSCTPWTKCKEDLIL